MSSGRHIHGAGAVCSEGAGEGGVLLIHPPVTKPCEPPAGIARLAGALARHGVPCRVLDANLEGILHLVGACAGAGDTRDTWTGRALRHLPGNMEALRRPSGYLNRDRYRQAVLEVDRVLAKSAPGHGIRISLGDYTDPELSPLRSCDLLRAAEDPERNAFHDYFSRRLGRLLHRDAPAAVGFSLNFLSQALTVFAMMGFLKRECPGLPIIVGGGLVTSWMRGAQRRNPFEGLADHVIEGEGEGALCALLGARYAEGADIPRYDPFPKEGYLAPGFILPYSASTGCYWHRCSFCPEKAEANPYRPVPPARAVAEVNLLAGRSHPALLHFLDNAVSPGLMEELILRGPGVPWYGFARITPHLADPDFCRALKRSGCRMVKLGLESGDQGVLDELGKGIELDTASRALRALAAAGIGTYVYLLFGTPAETLEKARRTMEFTVRHGACIDFLNTAVFNMPVASPEAEQWGTAPFYEGDLSLYTAFAHPGGWDRGEVRRFLSREFSRHPAVAAILRRDPPLFTSNHAPFFVGDDGTPTRGSR